MIVRIAFLVLWVGVEIIQAVPLDLKTPSITPDELRTHVQYIAGEEMEGRAPAGEGSRKTGEYLMRHVQALSMTPAPGTETYDQSVPIDRFQGVGKGTRGEVAVSDRVITWIVDQHFQPFLFSASVAATGAVVFAGYGITAPEYGYDDYRGLDMKGKIAVIFRHEPQERDPRSVFKGVEMTSHAWFSTKVKRAEDVGAAALVIVNDPGHGAEDEFVALMTGGQISSLPVIQAKRSAVDLWFKVHGLSLSGLHAEIDQTGEPASRELEDVNLDLSVELQRTQVMGSNVIGFLEGSDPVLKQEVVVVGAHRDHLGRGEHGGILDKGGKGNIHYGADDNGSGTATLMEVAEALALAPQRPKRSLLFIWFDGEESGLLGSAYYVNYPLIPLERTVAMINMDMVGRSPNHRVSVTGFGSSPAFEGFAEKFQRQFPELTIDPGRFPAPAASDQMSFYGKNIPALFLYTGLHEDYHRVTDTWEKLLYDDMAKIGMLCRAMVWEVANVSERPVFNRVRQAFLGIRPDPQRKESLVIAQVTPQSPAEKSDLRSDDVIQSVNGHAVSNFEELVTYMANRQPGEKVRLKIHRGTSTREVEIQLGERPE